MLNLLALAIFWSAALLLIYTAVGYAAIIRALARTQSPLQAGSGELPTVTVVLAARNEESRIAARVENLLAAEYPPDRLHIIVVSNGSTDATAERARLAGGDRVTVLDLPQSGGKADGLNCGVAEAESEIVVFADARQRFTPETIARLASHFSDPRIGAVSGSLQIDPSLTGLARGVESYWRREKQLRAAEARLDSCIGCTGAVYAIRRALFRPIPPDTILDDVVIPMQIAQQGYRVLHDESALAQDPQPLEPELERVRKKRTLAGNFQMLFRYPAWLLPWRHRLWLQLISHKYLRLLTPLFLALIFAASALLLPRPLYLAAFAVQSALYLCAGIGLAAPSVRFKLFSLPAGFVFLNLAIVRAFAAFLGSGGRGLWTTQAPRGEPNPTSAAAK